MAKKIGIGFLLLAVVFGAWYLLYSDQWLENFNQERQEEAQEYREKGLLAGQLTDQQGCQDQALANFNACRDSNFVCTVNQGVFLKACYETARKTEGFCDDLPAFNEKATEEEKDWAKYNCWDMDIRGEGCRLLLRQRLQLCHDQTSGGFLSDLELNRQD